MRDVRTASTANPNPTAGQPSGIRAARTRVRLGFFLCCAAGNALAERPPIVVPAHADAIVEYLPAGYCSLVPRQSSGAMVPAQLVAEADTLLGAAARTGDSRLAARAEALLSRLPADSAAIDVLRARAFAAQHRHDFATALRLLDRLLAREPRDGSARMSRAQIQLVQGRLDIARADCEALSSGIDADNGMLCTASVALRCGDFVSATDMLDRWLALAARGDSRRGYASLMRAEVAARAGATDAERWFRTALIADPADVRTLAAYARWLRAVHRDRDVESLLAATDVDGLQLQRALAAHAIDAPSTKALADAQQRRYNTAHAVGSQPEMRDEADFLLQLRGQPVAALALAQKNFESQRDAEDVDVLVRAATAASRPEALAPLRAWAEQQGVPLPASQVAAR